MRKMLKSLDALLEYLGIVFLGAIVLVVTWAVVARSIFGTEPGWSAQVSISLMIWAVALGTAIGFREQSHTSVNVLVEKFSLRAQKWAFRFTHALVLVFGLFLIVRGLQLIFNTEQWILYTALPISGFMICVYATLQLMGVRTQRSEDQQQESANESLDE